MMMMVVATCAFCLSNIILHTLYRLCSAGAARYEREQQGNGEEIGGGDGRENKEKRGRNCCRWKKLLFFRGPENKIKITWDYYYYYYYDYYSQLLKVAPGELLSLQYTCPTLPTILYML